MNTPHAMEISPDAMAALREFASRRYYSGQARIEALVQADRPLTPAERETLLDELVWWQQQRTNAERRVREITGRLARQ